MNLLNYQQISIGEWDDLLITSKYGSAFQTPLFYKICNETTGLSAEVIGIKEGIKLSAICVVVLLQEKGIKNYFSRRAIIFGGPVLNENIGEDALGYLLRSMRHEFKRRCIYIEIRNLNDYSNFKEVFRKNNWSYIPYLNFIVDCRNKELLFQRLGNNRKRQIKKAISSGVVIKEAENIIELREYYSILKKLYDQKIKKPLLPKDFFEEIFNRRFAKCFLVKYMGKIIGGIICPVFTNKCIYEFYVCGLDEEYKDQFPSTMATWAAMDYASANNIPVFDFMGAGRAESDYGVREFKARFGGNLVEHGRFIMINRPILYKMGELALKIMRTIDK